jgi:hypothetical protein
MKPNELMVEDWVIRKGVSKEPMRIYNINVSAGTVYLDQDGRGVTEKFENIEPIPLTLEILKKNGFVYADLPFEDFYEGYGLHIHGGNYADGHSNWYIICGINVSMNVTHVHELQHVFKLCGIEKDIIL